MFTNDAAMSSPARGPLTSPTLSQLQEEKFRFTPVKLTLEVPRVWDRKLSTPFLTRPRSRKVWKRFRSSFNSMKTLQQMIATTQNCVEHDFSTEINSSRTAACLRGIKRRCFTLGENSDEPSSLVGGKSRGRSFLETKWETDASGRRRKLPAIYGLVDKSEPMTMGHQRLELAQSELVDGEFSRDTSTSVAQMPVEQDESVTSNALALPVTYPRSLHGQSSWPSSEEVENTLNIKELGDIHSPQIQDAGGDTGDTATTTTLPHDGDAVLDAIMTEDRHELSSTEKHTDGQIATACATATVQKLTAEQESTLVRSALRSSLDGEDTALLNSFLSKAKAKREAKAAAQVAESPEKNSPQSEEVMEMTEMPTPPSRRALEDLDANSPSPQKTQLSPTKGLVKDLSDENDPPPTSPRRSARNSNAAPPRKTTAAAVRNTFSLRRAKGTEFVFLQRSEAQELALETRRNTRQNKGDSLPPKFMLQTLAQQSSVPLDDDKSARKPGRPKKQVSWNEEHLVQYEGGNLGGKKHRDDVDGRGDNPSSRDSEKRKAASRRLTRSQSSPETGGDNTQAASTTAPATATPRTRRVRRLGTPKTAMTSLDSSPSLSPSPERRKKLTPKSPKTAFLATSSKKTSGSSTSTSKAASVSSGSGKSARILKAHAGSTPMPRRVRSRA
ncbi:hypothetical protein EYZ11_010815 [Aspergillus tanneri]|uniref:Uncharacterized protein n=1 Tax=Aspergillus tanneri TaxID=1220188 RepID=A0A4S3J6J2_9EURO|nr:uncharacterized protein ATNIH1004_004543 [Aspergillus tanneri]KAA8648658.1 hypothetical protein ATNIH1004_004543 [Aspergillus tanneri]THC89738.1 hypothetical protein EYZ11_010815 [Aspergillus tanneri]